MFNLPINDERIQTLTEEQIDFMIWSDLLDNPESLKRASQQFYDPEFDDYDQEGEDSNLNNDTDEDISDDNLFNTPIENKNSMLKNWENDGGLSKSPTKFSDFEDDWEEV